MIKAIGAADWYVRDEIREALVEIYDTARPLVEMEIAGRSVRPPLGNQSFDVVLSTLVRVRTRAEEKR